MGRPERLLAILGRSMQSFSMSPNEELARNIDLHQLYHGEIRSIWRT
jgi:hypothetical protein